MVAGATSTDLHRPVEQLSARVLTLWPTLVFLPFGARKSTLVKGIGEVRSRCGGYLAAPRLCTVDVHIEGEETGRERDRIGR